MRCRAEQHHILMSGFPCARPPLQLLPLQHSSFKSSPDYCATLSSAATGCGMGGNVGLQHTVMAVTMATMAGYMAVAMVAARSPMGGSSCTCWEGWPMQDY